MTSRRRYQLALQQSLMILEDLPMTEPDRPASWDDQEWAEYLEWRASLTPLDPQAIHLEAISKPKRKRKSRP